MEEPKFDIPIEEPKAEFAKHLEPDYNKRIIFSAPFGTGKTYFLDKFFKDRSEKVIHLFPVNYSVSSNEDVFELIKFDILLQLLEDDNIELDDNSFSNFFIAQFFVLQNADRLVEWFLNKFWKLGKNINNHAKTIDKLVNEYQKFKNEMTTNADKSTAIEFLASIKNKPGTAYEGDAITTLIHALLQQYPAKERKTILIIDDLDRIDPEHIFRLLNVFAAHFDIGEPNTNKFGFDKVIFVCDMNNVRNIFHAKYGIDTDFTGYIDKFYSTETFIFNNLDAIIDTLAKFTLQKFYIDNFKNQTNFSHLSASSPFKRLFKIITIGLLNSGALNLRAVLKIQQSSITPKFYILKFRFFGEEVSNTNSYIIMIFDILKSVYGNYCLLLHALKKAAKFTTINLSDTRELFSYRMSDDMMFFCEHALPILTIDKDFKNGNGVKSLEYPCKSLGLTLNVEVDTNRFHFNKIMYCTVGQPRLEPNIGYIPLGSYFDLLIEVFEKLQYFGYLKD